MRKSLVILLCLSVSYIAMAQEKNKQKEIGLVFNNLDNFGLTYKTGTNRSLWRFNTLFISGDSFKETADNILRTQNKIGFGVKVGKEYRKETVDNLEFRFGGDLSFTSTRSKSEYKDENDFDNDSFNELTTFQPGFNFILGFNYIMGENLLIGAEFLPSFSYTMGESLVKRQYINNGEELKSDISGFNYGLSNTSALISLAYRF